MKKDITIAGAGLVGSLLSIYLAKRGHKVRVCERRQDMRKEAISAGRSINLALSDRGLLALEKVGLAEEIKKISIPMYGRYIHNIDGSTAFQPYGKDGQSINSVSRSTLNKKLMDFAEELGIEIFFDHKYLGFEQRRGKSLVVFAQEGKVRQHVYETDLIFGADGAFSASRLHYQLRHSRFDYHQYYINCGYKELTIPPTVSGDFAMEANALHIWPRKEYMLIALPNLDKTFTCTLFFPFEGQASFSQLDTKEKVKDFFERTFPDAVPLMPEYTNDFFNNPSSSLVTIKCFPWVQEDKFALIGDAAHAIVPFFGQGMNCGFEDCRVLDELIEKHEDNWTTILQQYQMLRKPDADAIADMAVNNFAEMSTRTADPKFLLQKKIEARLNEKYPGKWIPAYSQVTFNPQIRYSDALHNSIKQEAIMQEVMETPGIAEKWQTEEIEKLILSKL